MKALICALRQNCYFYGFSAQLTVLPFQDLDTLLRKTTEPLKALLLFGPNSDSVFYSLLLG